MPPSASLPRQQVLSIELLDGSESLWRLQLPAVLRVLLREWEDFIGNEEVYDCPFKTDAAFPSIC